MPVKPVARPTMGKMSFRKKADLISTFTMSSTLPKCIALIVKRIHLGDLLDCPLFATKPPFHPRSSRSSFLKCLYTKHFTKQALLDLPESLIPRGEVHRFRGKTRHFPREWRRKVRREKAVELVSRQARGESAPKSWEFPTLSPGKETAGATRGGCGVGVPVSHGGKCTKIAGNHGTFPEGWKRQVRREGSVEQVARQARGESAPESQENPALSGGKTTMACGSLVAGGVCGGGGFGKSCYI